MMNSYTGYTKEKLGDAKKRTISHCLNLECKKEQLLILIKKLNTISGQRQEFLFRNNSVKGISSEFGLRKSSISDELKRAEESLNVVDIEIKNAKHQMKVIEKILKDR